jgi:hypothetical protein
MAASLILHHQLSNPSSPPLFRAAIFLCAPLPFSSSLSYGIDSRAYFGVRNPSQNIRRPTVIPNYLIPSDAEYLKPEGVNPFYQMFHYSVDEVRINIPTAHVYGRRDKLWRTHAMDLVKMCGRGAFVYEHDGAHNIPRDEAYEICDVIEMAVAKAALR